MKIEFILKNFKGILFLFFLWVLLIWINCYFHLSGIIQEELPKLQRTLGFTMATTLVTFLILTLLINYIKAFYESETEKQKSFILSLKKQINAHFTVNVLNIIRLLAKKGEMEKTYDLCDGLSYLLRYANDGDEFIDCMEEFFILQKYTGIMEIRCNKNFTADFDIDDRLYDCKIPRMLIQPILENAITHGFQYMESGGILTVRATREEDAICIEVTDNGCGISDNELDSLTEKIKKVWSKGILANNLDSAALANIERRVALYYGAGYGIKVLKNDPAGTKVLLRLGFLRDFI